jgi:hypothetical protein
MTPNKKAFVVGKIFGDSRRKSSGTIKQST